MAKAPSLGVVRLDYDYEPQPGDMAHPSSFAYPVYYRRVPGLTFEMCQSGVLTASVRSEFVKAVTSLQECGVQCVSGDCGFMVFFQDLARRCCTLPICMSSLSQLPAVTNAFAKTEQVAIFTASARSLEPMRSRLRDECGVDPCEGTRFVIVGCAELPGFEGLAEGHKVDAARATRAIVAKAQQVLATYPQVRAFVFECTELPPFSDAVRHSTKLPVFDAITACDFFMSSRCDNRRFGLNGWQRDWEAARSESDQYSQRHREQLLRQEMLSNMMQLQRVQREVEQLKPLMAQPQLIPPVSRAPLAQGLPCRPAPDALRQEMWANTVQIQNLQSALYQMHQPGFVQGQQPPLQATSEHPRLVPGSPLSRSDAVAVEHSKLRREMLANTVHIEKLQQAVQLLQQPDAAQQPRMGRSAQWAGNYTQPPLMPGQYL